MSWGRIFVLAAAMLLILVNIPNIYSTTTFVVRVLDIDGDPVEGALVTLIAPPPGAYVVASGETDRDGYIRFVLDSPPNEVTITVAWKNIVVYIGKVSPYQGSVIIEANIGDIYVRALSTSKNPIEGLTIRLSWLSVDGIRVVNSVTNMDGVCIFKKMPLIKYNLTIYRDNIEILKKVFDAGVNREINIFLELFYFSLNILDRYGNPLTEVSVKLYGNGVMRQGLTDSNGKLIFRYLPKGTYTLEITYYGYRESSSVNLYSDEEINIILGNFTKHMLRIIITDDRNKPIPFTKVEIRSGDGTLYISGYTDHSGVYIANLYPGVYIVSAYYKDQTKTLDIRLEMDEDLKIVFKSGAPPYQPVETLGNIFEHISKNLILLVFLVIFVVFVIIVLFHYTFISRHIV